MAEGKGGSGAAIVALIGGILMAVGAVLAWAKVSIDISFGGQSFSQSETVKGLDTGDGKTVLVIGIIVVLLAIAALAVKGQMKLLGGLALLGSLIAGGLGVWDWVDLKNKTSDITKAAEAAAQGNAEIAKLIAAGIKVGASIGLYLVIIGGVVGLIGGILMLLAPKPAPAGAGMMMPPTGQPMAGMPEAPAMPTTPAMPETPPMPGTPPTPPTPPTDPGGGTPPV